MVLLKESFENVYFEEKKSANVYFEKKKSADNNFEKLPSMQRINL